MILTIIAIVFLVLIAILLFSPIVFVVDTSNNEYHLNLSGFFGIGIVRSEETWRMKFKILFLTFTINPLQKGSTKKIKKTKFKKKNTRAMINLQKHLPLVRKTVKAISIKKLYVNIDTNDYPLNAQLMAITPYINQNNIFLNINFENRNSCDFKAITYLYKLIGVAITTYIFKN